MTFMDDRIAKRLGGTEFGKSTRIYKFKMIKLAKAEAKKSRPDLELIDMGVGEPDQPADPEVVKVLAREAGKPENRWYADNGIIEFQEAAAEYLNRVFGVKGLLPTEHIVHGIGSKPVLAMMPLCLVDPQDVVLTTVPGYPVTATYARYLGGDVVSLPLLEENGFLPDLDSIDPDLLKRAKMLYINYPNNPTGAVATVDFFKKVVKFAKANSIVIIHDAAYAGLTYGENRPLSLLNAEGAMDVGLEIHSLSKAFNMTGWRMAFVAGNPKLVKAYATIKDNTDSGQFRAIQKAGAYALRHPEITERICEKYSRRFDLLVSALKEVGFNAKKPGGSFYCYVKAPVGAKGGVEFKTAAEFSEYLIKKALISTVPWDDAGAWVRFSVTFEAETEEEERAVINEMKARMEGLDLRF